MISAPSWTEIILLLLKDVLRLFRWCLEVYVLWKIAAILWAYGG